MRVDFYQISRDPVEEVVALLARNTLRGGERLLVVDADPGRLERIGTALWRAAPEDSFLANGTAGGVDDASQPILLSDRMEPANGARYVVLADGQWREGDGFSRTFLVFDDAALTAARACWKELAGRAGLERNFWKQDGGRWVKAA